MAKKKNEIGSTGRKIKKARLDKKLTLDFVAAEAGMKKEFLKNVETGEEIPSVGALLQISRALGIDSGFFLKDREESDQERADAYTKRTDNYAYTPLSSEDENKHLKAFRIVVEASKPHKGVGFRHEGEEFVYVLKGEVEITVGDNTYTLKPSDSLHFNSGIKHDLKNTGPVDAELIVVVYAP